jgi:hypothetical protein
MKMAALADELLDLSRYPHIKDYEVAMRLTSREEMASISLQASVAATLIAKRIFTKFGLSASSSSTEVHDIIEYNVKEFLRDIDVSAKIRRIVKLNRSYGALQEDDIEVELLVYKWHPTSIAKIEIIKGQEFARVDMEREKEIQKAKTAYNEYQGKTPSKYDSPPVDILEKALKESLEIRVKLNKEADGNVTVKAQLLYKGNVIDEDSDSVSISEYKG